ncbi:hypothetical protein [Streptomyces sp. NPDC057287]|uniref:hypothetical protein n=1 Tax=Streptomyces sp. NPDC057287 TaxID=3346086 RepID=UPI003626D0CB
MSTATNAAPLSTGTDADADNRADAGHSYRDNQQRLEQGMAVMGGIAGNVTVINGVQMDEAVAEHVFKPRLREGPYPADEVTARLHGFVEPPAYAQCRKILDSHLLILWAGSSTGVSTTAFALLADCHGVNAITGLDCPEDLARWRPKEARGYVLQGLTPRAAASLSEAALNALAALLRDARAHLVVTVGADTALPRESKPWQCVHRPPLPAVVAARQLNAMAEEGDLSPGQVSAAREHLSSPDFSSYLRDHPLPQDAVAVAEGLRDLVVSERAASSVLEELRAGSPAAAHQALAASRHRADSLSLMAAISLLAGQDRTIVEEFSVSLRPLIDERCAPASGRPDTAAERDLLGSAFHDRLEAVGARLMPPRFTAGQRYPVQAVAFFGQHRSESLLRCLLLDYEGMTAVLWKALSLSPHHSGVELAAGRALGKTLAHATGPNTLRQLAPFAASEYRWHRRLVSYALGELAERPSHTAAVGEQLRQWSRSAAVTLHCTVAETCASSYGLARPTTALRLMDTALSRPGEELDSRVRTAVSFALSVLLSEKANRILVLDHLLSWQRADQGTQHHTMAVHVIKAMSEGAFPSARARGLHRVRLADLLTYDFERAFDLVVTALGDPDTYEAMSAGLFLIERDPEQSRQTAFPYMLGELAGVARSHRGALRFLLRRHRSRNSFTAEGLTS